MVSIIEREESKESIESRKGESVSPHIQQYKAKLMICFIEEKDLTQKSFIVIPSLQLQKNNNTETWDTHLNLPVFKQLSQIFSL